MLKRNWNQPKRVCPKCGREKTIMNGFGRDKQGGIRSICKTCDPMQKIRCIKCHKAKNKKAFSKYPNGAHKRICKSCEIIAEQEKQKEKDLKLMPERAWQILMSREELAYALFRGLAQIHERDFSLTEHVNSANKILNMED